jgi:hypothetical protein
VVPYSICDEATSLVDHPILTEYGCSPDTDTALIAGGDESLTPQLNRASDQLPWSDALPSAASVTTSRRVDPGCTVTKMGSAGDDPNKVRPQSTAGSNGERAVPVNDWFSN